MTKTYQRLEIEVCHVSEDIVRTSVIEQGVQWASGDWTNEMKGDFE